MYEHNNFATGGNINMHPLHRVEEYPIARYVRDSRLTSIGGGADEVMMGIIAKGEGWLAGL